MLHEIIYFSLIALTGICIALLSLSYRKLGHNNKLKDKLPKKYLWLALALVLGALLIFFEPH